MTVAGIDGGQSGSRTVLADESGTLIVRADGPPLFADGGGRPLVERMGALLQSARDRAGFEGPIEAVVAGISGHDDAAFVPEEALGARRARIVHDSVIAHAGALAGYHGIVVAAGSGSVALGTDGTGRSVRHGGWGRVFGDEGAAYWIGRSAVAAAMRAHDAGTATGLERAACRHFAVATLRDVQTAARRGSIGFDAIAAFAPPALSLADDGDAVATTVRAGAARALADLVVGLDAVLEPTSGRGVSYAGNVFANVSLREAWRETLLASLERPRVIAPRAEPVIGAVILAFRDAGREPPSALFHERAGR